MTPTQHDRTCAHCGEAPGGYEGTIWCRKCLAWWRAQYMLQDRGPITPRFRLLRGKKAMTPTQRDRMAAKRRSIARERGDRSLQIYMLQHQRSTPQRMTRRERKETRDMWQAYGLPRTGWLPVPEVLQ